MISGPPPPGQPVPGVVRQIAGRRSIRPVWRNEAGGLTFEIAPDPTAHGHSHDGRWFVKWAAAGSGLRLDREATRLRWAGRYALVPPVLDEGADADESWLVTGGLPGESAVVDRWKADPRTGAAAIGAGLRQLHDRLPVPDCPFSWRVEDRLATVRRFDATGQLDPTRWHPDHAPLGVAGALARLADVPPVDRLVVCQGDSCAPNTLIGTDGRFAGHVDLGALGVADRWADLAVATWSLEWNYGPGWAPTLLDAYGVAPDPVRVDYYRLLWDLS